MKTFQTLPWRKVGIGASVVVLLSLTAEYSINLGKPGFDATDHWLSEYVLSDSTLVVLLMKASFFGLGLAALTVGKLSREWFSKMLFFFGATGLAAMAFFDTDPNDGRIYPMHFPPTPGNMHQVLLMVAMGATLLGISLRVFWFQSKQTRRSKYEAFLFGAALCSTVIQTFLSQIADTNHTMTRFGGITERIIVIATLTWVISFCSRD